MLAYVGKSIKKRLKTKKVRFYPDFFTMDALWGVSDACTLLWNMFVSEILRDEHVTYHSQKDRIPDLKQEILFLQIPSSQTLQQVPKRLHEAVASHFALKKAGFDNANPPGFRSRKYFYTLDHPQRKAAFDIEGRTLKLAHGIKHGERLEILLPNDSYEKVKAVQICFQRGKWYACLTYEIEDVPLRSLGHAIYFDPGSLTTLTGLKTTGEFYEYSITPLREVNKSTQLLIDQVKSKRDRCKRESRRWRRFAEQIKKLYAKMSTRTRLYLHTFAKRILESHPDTKTFFIGNWSKSVSRTGNAFRDKAINKSILNNLPLQKLTSYLDYKAYDRGQIVDDDLDERGSSSTCVICGYCEKHEPEKRTFRCANCEFQYSRDHHSCLNFAKKHEPALWQRLSGDLPDRSERTELAPFSLKLRRTVVRLHPNSGCPH